MQCLLPVPARVPARLLLWPPGRDLHRHLPVPGRRHRAGGGERGGGDPVHRGPLKEGGGREQEEEEGEAEKAGKGCQESKYVHEWQSDQIGAYFYFM